MNPILVPTDFSVASAKAVQYAAELGKTYHTGVKLLHIISAPAENNLHNLQKSVQELEADLQETAQQLAAKFELPASWALHNGSIFDAIDQAAETWQSPLVVLGNHDSADYYQQLFGPEALRLAGKAKVAYLLVNEFAQPVTFENIVLPVTASANQQAKLNHVLALAEAGKTKIHILYQFYSEPEKMKLIEQTINDFKEKINQNGLTLYKMQQPANMSFTDFLLGYAEEADTSLLVLDVANHDKETSHYVEEKLVNNSKNIPVLCVPDYKES